MKTAAENAQIKIMTVRFENKPYPLSIVDKQAILRTEIKTP